MQLDGVPAVHLDLRGLVFADTASVRELARFATRARLSGREFHTRGANSILHTTARVLEAERDLGMQ